MNREKCAPIHDTVMTAQAGDFIENLIQKQLEWYAPGVDIEGKSPAKNPNHDYWKEIVEIQVQNLRRANDESLLFEGQHVMQPLLDKAYDLQKMAHDKKITFREAYTRILIFDYKRILRLKNAAHLGVCREDLANLQKGIQ